MSDDRKDLPPVSAPNFNARIRETLSTYLGYRGNKLDRGVTLRDLSEANIIALSKGFLASSGGKIPPIAGPGTALGAYEPDLTPAPTPTGFAASAAISNIFIEHDAPLYAQGHGHGKTVVYGATWDSGALPTFSDAVKITEFTGTVFSHPTNPATTWHLWIKWVTVDGEASAAPAGGTNGLVVTTGQDVSRLVAAMTGPGNPFTVLPVDTVIGGVTFPAGTYSTQAFIHDAQIANAKIANLAVDSAKIDNLAVTTGKINDLAVSSAKIDNLAVTSAKIDNLAVTRGKIADLAVNTLQIEDNAVTVPVYAVATTFQLPFDNTWVEILRLEIDSKGAPFLLMGAFSFAFKVSSSNAFVTLKVFVNGVQTSFHTTSPFALQNAYLLYVMGYVSYQSLVQNPISGTNIVTVQATQGNDTYSRIDVATQNHFGGLQPHPGTYLLALGVKK